MDRTPVSVYWPIHQPITHEDFASLCTKPPQISYTVCSTVHHHVSPNPVVIYLIRPYLSLSSPHSHDFPWLFYFNYNSLARKMPRGWKPQDIGTARVCTLLDGLSEIYYVHFIPMRQENSSRKTTQDYGLDFLEKSYTSLWTWTPFFCYGVRWKY